MAQAVDDLEAAVLLRNGEKHAQACFMSQQAGEKALKAALYSQLRESRTHVLKMLVRDLDTTAPKNVLDCARVLDDYYIPTRYANGHDSGLQSEQAIEYAGVLIEFARSRMAQSR
jgi:HEPN domain-containing protein